MCCEFIIVIMLLGRLVHARDDAFNRLPPDGAAYHFNNVQDNYNEHIYRSGSVCVRVCVGGYNPRGGRGGNPLQNNNNFISLLPLPRPPTQICTFPAPCYVVCFAYKKPIEVLLAQTLSRVVWKSVTVTTVIPVLPPTHVYNSFIESVEARDGQFSSHTTD